MLFIRKEEIKGWQFTGRDWAFAKLNIDSFSDINDTLLLNTIFPSNAITKYDDESNATNQIKIGDFIVVKNKARINIRYVFKFVDQQKGEVKIDYKSFRIKSKELLILGDLDILNHLILYSDLKTLEELVIEQAIDIDVCDKFTKINMTPLIFAMKKGKKDVFDKLIELEVDINKKCRGNRTALMYASSLFETYYFQKLVESDANCSIQDENGKTVHDYLNYYNKIELLKLIEKK